MSTDYTKKTNADLIEILKTRNLPHSGKKAELIARLQESDNASSTGAKPATSTAPVEDEIDWDDNPALEAAANATTEASAATIAAGGVGEVPNPVAVPNQQVDTDPATTSDLKVESEGVPHATEGTTETATEPAKPEIDFAAGLDKTDVDNEMEKRRKRALKFGTALPEGEESKTEAETEAEKKLERAKKFGTGEASGGGIKGLDEALPERKRRRDEDGGGRGGKRSRFAGRGRGGRRNGGEGRPNAGRVEKRAGTGGGLGLSAADRAAAEARKQRFTKA